MLFLKSFCFNAFQQNTYLIYDDEGRAFIIDPGNSTAQEQAELKGFITEQQLKPERLLLTHAHLDHVFGNRFVYDEYGLLPEVHQADLFLLERMKQTATLYGLDCDASPMPQVFLTHGQQIGLGKYMLECLHCPGHSPGSMAFYIRAQKLLISGDVLFRESIGRSDLPGGDYNTLLNSIRSHLFALEPDVTVYSGHGPSTTIAHEQKHNPFLS